MTTDYSFIWYTYILDPIEKQPWLHVGEVHADVPHKVMQKRKDAFYAVKAVCKNVIVCRWL